MSQQTTVPDEESLRVEYREVSENLRHHDNLTWYMFSLYFTANGILLNILPRMSSSLVRSLALFAILMSVTFGIHFYKSAYYYQKRAQRGREIEATLRISQYTMAAYPETGLRRYMLRAMAWTYFTALALAIIWAFIVLWPSLAN